MAGNHNSGRRPQPTRLKILRGNPGKRKLNDQEPKPRGGVPKCPEFLDKEAKVEWRRVVPELQAMGLMATAYRAALAQLCQAWAEFVIATKTVKSEGRTLTAATQHGERTYAHPAVAQQRSAWAAYRSYCAMFGLDPSSITKIKSPSVGAEPVDDFDKFVNSRGG